ncbi:MAG TPA: peptidylprolyl isomerase, partial [Ignavibacteriaceae bacterium]|nr:peptidylprolyl isomerase [Ignavibacteriaceae bacterium]
RDALFNKEIKSKIKIDEEDILKGIIKYNTRLNVDIFSSKDSAQVYKIFNELSSNRTINLLSEVEERDSIEISFGDIKDELLEDSLFSLHIGEFTKPQKKEEGWYLFYLKNKSSNIAINEKGSIENKVIKIIQDRRTEAAYYDFMKKTFQGKIIEADENLFLMVSENIIKIFKESNQNPDTSSKFYLNENEMEKLKAEIGTEDLNKIFFTVDDRPVILKEFLADMLLEGFSTKSFNSNEINFRLNKMVKYFIEKEYLTNLGYKQGLHNLPEVKEQLEIWKTNFLAQLYKNSFTDSARSDENEIYQHFLENQEEENIKQIKIIELLTDSLEVIEQVLNKLENGESFKILAEKFSNKSKIESEFIPVTMFGEIGRIASSMKINEVYGPLKVENGYSIFQLIDVKETSDSIKQTFEEARERIKGNLFYNKMNDILTRKTVDLANKYKISINEGVLNSAQVMKIKMYVQRLMGFGGRISAVPFTNPWYEWIYKTDIKVVP